MNQLEERKLSHGFSVSPPICSPTCTSTCRVIDTSDAWAFLRPLWYLVACFSPLPPPLSTLRYRLSSFFPTSKKSFYYSRLLLVFLFHHCFNFSGISGGSSRVHVCLLCLGVSAYSVLQEYISTWDNSYSRNWVTKGSMVAQPSPHL